MNEIDNELLNKFLTPEGKKKIQEISDKDKKILLSLFTEHHNTKENINKVNFSYLLPNAKLIIEFINQGNIIINKAKEFTQNTVGQEKNVIRKLLEKTESKKINKQLFREDILQEITKEKASSNKEFIRIFSQLPNEIEKKKEFLRSVQSEFLEEYASNITIFAEEMRNLSFFLNEDENIDIPIYFNKVLSELLSQMKILNLNINYVPLFENYEKYAGFTRLVETTHNNLYENIKGLKRDDISEIISYGFGDKETKILLQ